MAIASAGKPLQRSTAHRLLIDFVRRVEQVRDERKWLFKVKTAVLFGSFLSDSTTLGDIDIALTMRPANVDKAAQEVAETQCRLSAQQAGRRFSNFLDYLSWPEYEVKRFLRSRRRISLHDLRMDGPIIEAGRHVAIYANESVIKGSIPLLETWPR
jgi:predicted nucleotidyltransferase